jgi:uncharacterized CHY-type Zn-finger protein
MKKIINCYRCEKNFEDKNYSKFGSRNAKRLFCNDCTNKLWKKKK